jgi:hypothetical protein
MCELSLCPQYVSSGMVQRTAGVGVFCDPNYQHNLVYAILSNSESGHWPWRREGPQSPLSGLSPSHLALISCANAANGGKEPKVYLSSQWN